MISPGSKTNINIAAYHEAGHALAALKEGRRVAFIGASHKSPGNGICFHATKPPNPYDITFNVGTTKAAWKYTLETTCADIRISLAGPLAEAKILGKPMRSLGARSDLENCLKQFARLNLMASYISQYTEYDPVIAENLLSQERKKVRHWIAHPKVWNAIAQMAQKLSIKKVLVEKDLNDLIGAASTPKRQAILNFSGNALLEETPANLATNPKTYDLREGNINQYVSNSYFPLITKKKRQRTVIQILAK